MGLSLLGSLGGAIIFTVPTMIFAEEFISFFTADAAVISMGGSYLRIISSCYIFTAVTFSLSSTLKSITDVKTPIIVSLIGFSLNSVLNYLLIFGKLGLPEMGVSGAAIATVIAKGTETVILITAIYLRKSPLAASNWREYFTYPKGFVSKIIKTTLPVVGNEMGWALGVFIYNKIYATLGTDSATAFSIAEQVAFLFMVAFIGTSAATATLMGNTIGKNSIEEARENSKRILCLAAGGALIMAILSAIFAPLWASSIFNVETEIMQETITILIICTAITLPFKVINMHGVNGLMRSGGDTHFSMFLDIGCLWLIGVPIAVVSATYYHLPVQWVYLLIGIEEVLKSFIVMKRVKSGKWINRVISG